MYEEWLDSVLPAPLTGPIEVTRQRPWSLVAKVPTQVGLLWFKENRAGTGHEAGMMQALARWAPGRVLEPVAVLPQRGWSLLPDGGPTAREVGTIDWPAMLESFANLQCDLAGHAEQMIALGMPDHRPHALAKLAETLPMPPGTLDPLRDFCAQLQQSTVPASIQHDDLHDGNMFASGRFFDWGDASLAHPFGVLLVSLRAAADKLGVTDTDPALQPLIDAYLDPFADFASPQQLRHEVRLAIHVTKVSRALSWRNALADVDNHHDFGDPVTGWLEELLIDVPVDG